MEDEMTPKLPGALSAYEKFVKGMEKLNKRGFEGTSGFLGSIGSLVKGVEKIASGAAIKMNLALTKKSERGFAKMVGDAVANALGGARIRLTASLPKSKMKMFSQDATLRTLYKDLPQPPDMIGGIQKFAEGGKVQGGTKGKDSVLGLLTPGEVVIPTDLVEKLEKAFETVSGTKSAIESGLGSKKDIEFYNKATMELAEGLEALAAETKSAGVETRARLSPQIVQLRERFEGLHKPGEKNIDIYERLFSKILGPARFVAIQTGLKNMQDNMGKLGTGASNAFGKFGGDQVRSVVDRIRSVRMELGLSAESAAEFNTQLATQSKELGTNFTKSMEGAEALIARGVKDRTKLIEQGPLIARANRVTGAEFDQLANSVFRFTNDLGGSNEQFQSVVNTINSMKTSADLAVNTPALMETLQETLTNPKLAKEGPENLQNILNNMLSLRAAAESVWAGDSGIEKIMNSALQGSIDDLAKVARLTGGAISTQEQLAESMRSRDGLIGAFSQIESTVKGLDPLQLKEFSKAVDLDSNLLKRMGDFNNSLDTAVQTTEPFEAVGGAMDKASAAIDKITTSGERLNNMLANLIGESSALQTFLEYTDEIPIVAIAAAASLGGNLLGGVARLGVGLFSAGRGALGMVGHLGKLGPMAMGAAGNIASFGKSFAMANPLLLAGAAAAGAVAFAIKRITDEYAVHEENMQALEGDAKVAMMTGSQGAQITNAQREINKLERMRENGALSDTQEARIEQLQGRIDRIKGEIKGATKQRVEASQPGANPVVTKPEVEKAMEVAATVNAENATDMGETNKHLAILVGLQQEQMKQAARNPNPGSPDRVLQQTRTSDDFTNSLSRFEQ